MDFTVDLASLPLHTQSGLLIQLINVTLSAYHLFYAQPTVILMSNPYSFISSFISIMINFINLILSEAEARENTTERLNFMK